MMRSRIAIDPNVRVRGNGTYAGFEDVQGELTGLQVGDAVEVFERESDLTGEGRVTEIDLARRLVYLSVEWSTLRPRVEQGADSPRFDKGGILPSAVSTSISNVSILIELGGRRGVAHPPQARRLQGHSGPLRSSAT